MANPLSMYVPIKQDDPAIQKKVAELAQHFVEWVKDGLNDSKIVHYAKVVLIPNPDGKGTQGILLSTEFDESMHEYLRVFWEQPGINLAIQGIASIAATPPDPPITDLDSFQNFIESVDLEADLYQAYSKSVKEIKAMGA
jgi:hypothetical protein